MSSSSSNTPPVVQIDKSIDWIAFEKLLYRTYQSHLVKETIAGYATKLSRYMAYKGVHMTGVIPEGGTVLNWVQRPDTIELKYFTMDQFSEYFKTQKISLGYQQHFLTSIKKALQMYTGTKKLIDSMKEAASDLAKKQRKYRNNPETQRFTKPERACIEGMSHRVLKTLEFVKVGKIEGIEARKRTQIALTNRATTKTRLWRDLLMILWFKNVPSRIQDLIYLSTMDDGWTNYIDTKTGDVTIRIHKTANLGGKIHRKVSMELCREIEAFIKYRSVLKSFQTDPEAASFVMLKGNQNPSGRKDIISAQMLSKMFSAEFKMTNQLYRKYVASMDTNKRDFDRVMATVEESARSESHSVGTHRTYYLKDVSDEDRARWGGSAGGEHVRVSGDIPQEAYGSEEEEREDEQEGDEEKREEPSSPTVTDTEVTKFFFLHEQTERGN